MAILSEDHFSAVGIKHCLLEGGIERVEIGAGREADAVCDRAGLVVIDALWGNATAVEALLRRVHDNELPVLVILPEARKLWVDAVISHGAAGVLTRIEARDHLPLAVQALRAGQTWMPTSLPQDISTPELSPREVETLRLYCDGLKIETIARRMHLSTSTVNTYLTRIRAKYHELGRPVGTRMALRHEAVKDGWVSTGQALGSTPPAPDWR